MLGFTIPESGAWIFPKTLTHVEVAKISNDFWQKRPKQGEWRLDLSQLEVLDSACLALLLEMLRQADTHQLSLKIKGMSKNLRSLLEAYGIFVLFEKSVS